MDSFGTISQYSDDLLDTIVDKHHFRFPPVFLYFSSLLATHALYAYDFHPSKIYIILLVYFPHKWKVYTKTCNFNLLWS